MSPKRKQFVPRRSGGLTRHARDRAAERHIPDAVVVLLRQFGRRESAGEGFHVTTEGMPVPRGIAARDWSGTRGVVVVEDRQRTVLTVYRRPPQTQRKRG